MKTIRIIGIIVLLALVIISVLFGGVFSVVTGTPTKSTKNDVPCGITTQYDFDTITIVYTTHLLQKNAVNPEGFFVTTCAPKRLTITENMKVLFDYSSDSGVMVDELTASKQHFVWLDNSKRLSDGSVFVMSGFTIDEAFISLYAKDDMSATSPYSSDKLAKNEPYYRNPGLYSIEVRNSGWDSRDRSLGSRFSYTIEPKKGAHLLDSAIITTPTTLSVSLRSAFPTALSYNDVCMSYGVTGVTGITLYAEECEGVPGVIRSGEESLITIDRFVINVTNYSVKAVYKNVQMITAAGVALAAVGDIITDEVIIAADAPAVTITGAVTMGKTTPTIVWVWGIIGFVVLLVAIVIIRKVMKK